MRELTARRYTTIQAGIINSFCMTLLFLYLGHTLSTRIARATAPYRVSSPDKLVNCTIDWGECQMWTGTRSNPHFMYILFSTVQC